MAKEALDVLRDGKYRNSCRKQRAAQERAAMVVLSVYEAPWLANLCDSVEDIRNLWAAFRTYHGPLSRAIRRNTFLFLNLFTLQTGLLFNFGRLAQSRVRIACGCVESCLLGSFLWSNEDNDVKTAMKKTKTWKNKIPSWLNLIEEILTDPVGDFHM